MVHVRKLILFMIYTCALAYASAQIKPIPIAQLDSLMAADPKPILLLISTEWCQYCAMQKQQIQKNKQFAEHHHQFYFVDFNAESRDKVVFQGREYKFIPRGINLGTHELATALNGSEQISYPTWILLDAAYNPLFRQPGLLRPSQLNELLLVMKKNLSTH